MRNDIDIYNLQFQSRSQEQKQKRKQKPEEICKEEFILDSESQEVTTKEQ